MTTHNVCGHMNHDSVWISTPNINNSNNEYTILITSVIRAPCRSIHLNCMTALLIAEHISTRHWIADSGQGLAACVVCMYFLHTRLCHQHVVCPAGQIANTVQRMCSYSAHSCGYSSSCTAC